MFAVTRMFDVCTTTAVNNVSVHCCGTVRWLLQLAGYRIISSGILMCVYVCAKLMIAVTRSCVYYMFDVCSTFNDV